MVLCQRALQPPIAMTSQDSQPTANLHSDNVANRTDGLKDQRSYSERPYVPTRAETPLGISGKHSIQHTASSQPAMPEKLSIDATPKEAPRAIFPEGYSRSRLNSLTKPEPMPSAQPINTDSVFYATVEQNPASVSNFLSIGSNDPQYNEVRSQTEPEISPAPVPSVPPPTEFQSPAPRRRDSSGMPNPLIANQHSEVTRAMDDTRPSVRALFCL